MATEKMTLANLSHKNDPSYLVTITPKAMTKHLLGWIYLNNPQQRYCWAPKGTLTASNHWLSSRYHLVPIQRACDWLICVFVVDPGLLMPIKGYASIINPLELEHLPLWTRTLTLEQQQHQTLSANQTPSDQVSKLQL